jgi:hypothetical protein
MQYWCTGIVVSNCEHIEIMFHIMFQKLCDLGWVLIIGFIILYVSVMKYMS